ncbi:MAG: zinc-binding dehydrogenase [Betaproteobacteria bacterium]|nr:zinc-binding dehydrogenase [Betaproteobacteria bacterium]
MRAIAVTRPDQVELVHIAPPAPGPYQALVRTEAACLCNATDGKLISGHFPGINTYPLILGHESAGVIQSVGDKVRAFKPGERAIGGLVFSFREPAYAAGWGGFCEYTLINDHDAMVADGVADEKHGWFECYEIQRPVPADIPLAEAVLMCTWREVYAGFGDFNLRAGEDVLIFGAGPVGLSFAKFGGLLGLKSIGVVDPNPDKRAKALAMGASEAFAPHEVDSASFIAKNGRRYDAVIDAVGSGEIINAALPLIRMAGSICVYGVIGAETISINKSAGPYNFNLYMHQWPTRFRESAAMEPLCKWIRDGKLRAAEFITHEFKLEEINAALNAVRSGKVIKALLTY